MYFICLSILHHSELQLPQTCRTPEHQLSGSVGRVHPYSSSWSQHNLMSSSSKRQKQSYSWSTDWVQLTHSPDFSPSLALKTAQCCHHVPGSRTLPPCTSRKTHSRKLHQLWPHGWVGGQIPSYWVDPSYHASTFFLKGSATQSCYSTRLGVHICKKDPMAHTTSSKWECRAGALNTANN